MILFSASNAWLPFFFFFCFPVKQVHKPWLDSRSKKTKSIDRGRIWTAVRLGYYGLETVQSSSY